MPRKSSKNSSTNEQSKSGRLAAAPLTLDEAMTAAPSIEALKSMLMPTGDLDIGEHATLQDIFERYSGEDSGWQLVAAGSLMWDAIKTAYFEKRKIGITSALEIHAIALHHFYKDHGEEFIRNPEAFRIPTEAEDDELDQINMAIGRIDPWPELNPNSPGFRVDLALGGGEIPEEEE